MASADAKQRRPIFQHAATTSLTNVGVGEIGESPRASPRASLVKPHKIRISANISRPDQPNTLASLTSRRMKKLDTKSSAGAESEVVRCPVGEQAGDAAQQEKPRKLAFTTACGESSLVKKEEALEQIMCAEAFAGFERMARHQLNKTVASRCCVDPDKAKMDLPILSQFYLDGTDVAEPDSESDDEMLQKHEYVSHHAGPGVPPDNTRSWGSRLGYGFAPLAFNQIGQDRIFVSQCGPFKLMGIVNSIGSQEIGSHLAQFIAEELPNAFFKSPWFTQENDLGTALSHAFDRTHRKAIRQIDCRLTGACVTVVLMDETTVYIAHIGDCRAVLAVPDPNANAQKYHFIPVPLTVDHKLCERGEFDRILEYGGDIRRCVNDNVHRLFFKDDKVPGLTLTRGIGHRMSHPIGVTHIPSLQVLQRRELHKDSFIVLGSGGVWNVMSERCAVNWIGKHFADPHEAAESLGKECKRRWDEPLTRRKAFVHENTCDSFSSLIVYPALDNPGELDLELENTGPGTQRPRQFCLGPHDGQVARRTWQEVKRANWKSDLASIMNGNRSSHLKPITC